MNGEVLRIGDKVIIAIPREYRERGYNPCPNGTEAKVIGFCELVRGRIENLGFEPGVYANKAWPNLRVGDGELTVFSGYLSLVDQNEYRRRVETWTQENTSRDWRSSHELVSGLPATPFWEGDRVRVHPNVPRAFSPGTEIFVVTHIDYMRLQSLTLSFREWPAYKVSDRLGGGWDISVAAGDMCLVERGKVWKFYHKEPLKFADLEEEARFFVMLGHTEEVRNPANNRFSWTKEEVLEAIRQGVAHGFFTLRGIPATAQIAAIRFRDENLGKRVAQATLEGFNLVY